MKRWRDDSDPLFHPAAPLDGSTLQQELGLSSGPAIGRLLDHLRRERAFLRVTGHTSALTKRNVGVLEQRLAVINSLGVNDDGQTPTDRIHSFHEHPPVHRQPATDL